MVTREHKIRITQCLEWWDEYKKLSYLVIIPLTVLAIWFCTNLHLAAPGDTTARVLAKFVIGSGLISIMMIELDLLSDAMGLAHTPRRMSAKLVGVRPRLKCVKEELSQMRADAKGRAALVEEEKNECLNEWCMMHSYTPFTRTLLVLIKVLWLVLIFSMISEGVCYLLNFACFECFDARTSAIAHLYLASSNMFLVGFDKAIPLSDWPRLLCIAEFTAGFLSLAIAVSRLSSPVTEELGRFRQALDWYFND